MQKKRKRMTAVNENRNGADFGDNIDDNTTGASSNHIPKKKLKKKHLYRPPTNEELIQYRETETLFNSNIFRLQIEEIIKEVTVKPKHAAKVEKWVDDFNVFLSKLPAKDETEITDQKMMNKAGVKVPLNQEPYESKGFFKFSISDKAVIIGSHKLRTAVGPNFTVDLQITTPLNFYIKNDSINHRYHRKRALYLSELAVHLKKYKGVEHLSFKFLNGNEYKPVLVIKPRTPLSEKATFILHVVCSENDFKPTRFAPTRNNVRESWYFKSDKSDSDAGDGPPTPYYNASVCHDLVSNDNDENFQTYIAGNSNVLQAIILLKIWTKQRKLQQFSGYVISMLVAYLIKNKIINPAMSSYQIVRTTWTFIGNSEWDKSGITLAVSQIAVNRPSLSDFHEHFPVVFVDSSGFHNCCYDLSLNTYLTVKNESLSAVKLLDSANGFDHLFLTTFKFDLQFDHILRFTNEDVLNNAVSTHSPKSLQNDFGTKSHKLRLKFLSDLLRRGLANRLTLLAEFPIEENAVSWSISDDSVSFLRDKRPIMIGFKLNPEEAFNLLDKGPPAHEEEAAQFREFWGAKSELRRFQDGAITETCVWKDSATWYQRRLIVKEIVFYLLKEKLGIEETCLYIADQVDNALCRKKFKMFSDFRDCEEESEKAMSAFDSLRNEIIALNDLPLYINSIQGTSSLFSFSDPAPPLGAPIVNKADLILKGKANQIRGFPVKQKGNERPVKCPKYVPETRAIIELGASGKWPNELEPFRRIKAAFHIQIAKALTEQNGLVTHAFPDHLKVLKDGFVFSLELSHQREIGLMKKYLDNMGVLRHKDTDDSLEKEYDLIHLPKLRSALSGLHKRNPCFGVASCMAKRWLSSHMIDNILFPHILVDLLMAHLFLNPEPYEEAVQPQVAFLRFLHLIISTNWNTQPLIVNFNEGLSKDAIAQIESNFKSARDSFPKVFVVTPYEGSRISYWSRRAPTIQILNRVIQLATAATAIIESTYYKCQDINVEDIFKAGSGYNAVIHLNNEFVAMKHYSVSRNRANVSKPPVYLNDVDTLPVINFDPVQLYLKDLRKGVDSFPGETKIFIKVKQRFSWQATSANFLRVKVNSEAILDDGICEIMAAYDDYAVFFCDTYGGSHIGVLFRPDSIEAKEFKISMVNGRKAVTKEGKKQLILNIDAVVEDFNVIGDGIVEKIDVNYDSFPLNTSI